MTMPFRLSAVAGLIFLGAMANAGAETTTDRYGKELKIEPTRNIFARFGLLGLKMNNKSEAAKDVTGPVLSAGERGRYCPEDADENGRPIYPSCTFAESQTIYGFATEDTIFANVSGEHILGLPEDVRVRMADPLPGAIGTLGMYFDEDKHWAVEVPIMALPFSIDIYGAGTFAPVGKIATAKALGFLVFGHYYFGQKSDKFRPSVSLTANYLLPFDVNSTPVFERVTGGVTKISSKGSLGLGWLVGGKYAINDRWDFNFNIGQFKAEVNSTITTFDTDFNGRSATSPLRSPIFDYWPGTLGDNLRGIRADGNLRKQLEGMKAYRNSNPANRVNGGANLGNYTRTQKQTLDPYVLMMTVGYNF